MSSHVSQHPAANGSPPPTVWGLDPTALHDRFWASRGVQVIRPGLDAPVAPRAKFYLLTDARTVTIFRLGPVADILNRASLDALLIRLPHRSESSHRETPVTDPHGNLLRLRRTYKHHAAPPARAVLVRDPDLARGWQQSPNARLAWRQIRRNPRVRRQVAGVKGQAFDRSTDRELAAFVKELIKHWHHPAATVPDIHRVDGNVWAHRSASIAPGIPCIGPVWIGAGREVHSVSGVLGPAALWDAPTARPPVREITWESRTPAKLRIPSVRSIPRALPRAAISRFPKRAFDFVFALTALVLTSPIFPIVMLAIWLEDGRPFFFAHRRETLGGREFPCLKFRSMCKDSEAIKQRIAGHNEADGPQFFIKSDPRLTRVGRLIRKLNIDELPQFINVLLGHMSVVGPRPSPYKENQYCPPWREARLSVRPGITGLWQVMRTRQQGQDFQEWIHYDLEYVQRAGWRMDLWIIWKTIGMILGRKRSQ